MKMKLYDRLGLLIGGIVSLLAGVFLLIGAVVLFKYGTYSHILLKILPYLMLVFGVCNCAGGVFVIMLPQRYHPNRRAFISQHTEHGEMRIAVSAVENLILRCVETHKEVKVIGMQINNRRGAVSVELGVAMNSNISIPHAVEQIQTQIKRYLAASSGIELREVGVSVERTEGDEFDLPVEQLAQAAEMMAGAQAVQDEEVAMHQRVFGRDTSKSVAEQVTEAEAIEAPEADETVAETEAEPETAEDAELAEDVQETEESEPEIAEEVMEEELFEETVLNEEAEDEWIDQEAEEAQELPEDIEDADASEDDESAEDIMEDEADDAEAQE